MKLTLLSFSLLANHVATQPFSSLSLIKIPVLKKAFQFRTKLDKHSCIQRLSQKQETVAQDGNRMQTNTVLALVLTREPDCRFLTRPYSSQGAAMLKGNAAILQLPLHLSVMEMAMNLFLAKLRLSARDAKEGSKTNLGCSD